MEAIQEAETGTLLEKETFMRNGLKSNSFEYQDLEVKKSRLSSLMPTEWEGGQRGFDALNDACCSW